MSEPRWTLAEIIDIMDIIHRENKNYDTSVLAKAVCDLAGWLKDEIERLRGEMGYLADGIISTLKAEIERLQDELIMYRDANKNILADLDAANIAVERLRDQTPRPPCDKCNPLVHVVALKTDKGTLVYIAEDNKENADAVVAKTPGAEYFGVGRRHLNDYCQCKEK